MLLWGFYIKLRLYLGILVVTTSMQALPKRRATHPRIIYRYFVAYRRPLSAGPSVRLCGQMRSETLVIYLV